MRHMKSTPSSPLFALLAGLLTALMLSLPSGVFAGDEGKISWLTDWSVGKKELLSNSKPGIIYFYNEKARPCHEMETSTFADPSIIAKTDGIIAVRLVDTENRDLANVYQLIKVPTVIFLDAQGREIDRAVGFKRADSFIQYLDRLNTRATQEASAPASASGKKFTTGAVDITKSVEGSFPTTFTIDHADATQVYLVGDFNDWREDATAMTRSAKGEWTATVHLFEGVYEYRFKTGDGVWLQDPSNTLRKPNPFGEYNSVKIVGNPKRSPMVSGRSVTFILFDPTATSIELAGSFNDWQRLQMYRNPSEPGMWGVRYTLPPGEYTYKYIVDNKWMPDPENYTPSDDGAGNVNSGFTIE
jgi:thioredoxin-related protein